MMSFFAPFLVRYLGLLCEGLAEQRQRNELDSSFELLAEENIAAKCADRKVSIA